MDRFDMVVVVVLRNLETFYVKFCPINNIFVVLTTFYFLFFPFCFQELYFITLAPTSIAYIP